MSNEYPPGFPLSGDEQDLIEQRRFRARYERMEAEREAEAKAQADAEELERHRAEALDRDHEPDDHEPEAA